MTANKKAALAGAAQGTADAASDGEIIAEVRKSQREVYRVTRREFKGYVLADVRVWYDDAATGEPRPGKGVAIKVEVLPAIVQALAWMVDGGER